MLSEILAVILAVVNGVIALYLLKKASSLLKSEPEWLNDFFEDKKVSFMEALTDENEDGTSFVDVLAQRFGKGFRMSLLAQKSGEARHEKMIEKRVFSAMKDNSPELKLAMAAMEKFGLEDLATPENLPALLQVAQKYGLFGSFINRKGSNRKPNNGNVPLM